jgi:hypothetical protein
MSVLDLPSLAAEIDTELQTLRAKANGASM